MEHERISDSINLWAADNADLTLYYSQVDPEILDVDHRPSQTSWSGAFIFTFVVIVFLAIVKRRRYIVGLWKAYLKLRQEEKERHAAGRQRRMSNDSIVEDRKSSLEDVKEDEQMILDAKRTALRSITVSEDILGMFRFEYNLNRIRITWDCCLQGWLRGSTCCCEKAFA
jgi:hypothetical protein